MTWRMLRFVRRIVVTVLTLFLLICGAEVGVRCYEVRTRRPLNPAKSMLGLGGLVVPSWTVRQELRPFAAVKVKAAGEQQSHLVRINSLGMRGEEVIVPKPADVFRVLCLGDELIFTPQTAEDEMFCTLLQQHLQSQSRLHVEVLNGGVPGACPLTEYLMLRHRWSGVQPDLVLLTLTEADFTDEAAYRRYARSDAEGTPLACRHPSLTGKTVEKPWSAWQKEFRLVDLGMSWCCESWRRQTDSSSNSAAGSASGGAQRLNFDQATTHRLLEPLIPLAGWCQQSNAKLCICCVTSGDGRDRQDSRSETIWAAVRQLAEQHQFQFVELSLARPSEGATTVQRWTPQEQRQLAEQLTEQASVSWGTAPRSKLPNRATPVSWEADGRVGRSRAN